jgi:rare lipoprotein A
MLTLSPMTRLVCRVMSRLRNAPMAKHRSRVPWIYLRTSTVVTEDEDVRRSRPREWTRAAAVIMAACLLLASACGKKNKRMAKTPSAPAPTGRASNSNTNTRHANEAMVVHPGYTEQGLASWYGIPYHGRRAADGEIYDMETLVAAHRTMPFNTWVKVTNVANNKTVDVRVIDRGPFVSGRIIDLSKAAARKIDLLGPGIGRVRLEVITAPGDKPADDFYSVQVGAFTVYENAQQAKLRYEQRYGSAELRMRRGRVTEWCVLVGKERSMEAAQKLAARLNVENKTVFVVRLDETIPAPPPGTTLQ